MSRPDDVKEMIVGGVERTLAAVSSALLTHLSPVTGTSYRSSLPADESLQSRWETGFVKPAPQRDHPPQSYHMSTDSIKTAVVRPYRLVG